MTREGYNRPKRVHTVVVRGSDAAGHTPHCSCGWTGVIKAHHNWALSEGIKHIKRARGA